MSFLMPLLYMMDLMRDMVIFAIGAENPEKDYIGSILAIRIIQQMLPSMERNA